MNPKYILVSDLFLGSMSIATAMETADEVKLEIARNRWFYNTHDSYYICNKFWDKKTLYELNKGIVRCEYTMLGLSFKPYEFWEKPIEDQLVYLKDIIFECDLLTEASNHHGALRYTNDERCRICLKSRSYSEELEKKFEEAVWKILSKDYKISFDDFITSLRSALKPQDRLYTAPLLMHFTNYLVPKYEFHYKTSDDRMKNIPYKTLKFPSEFELAIGIPNVGKVVYEAKE